MVRKESAVPIIFLTASDEEMDIILSLCVPKCESGKIKFCPEHKSCGRQKTAKEINEIISKSKEDM